MKEFESLDQKLSDFELQISNLMESTNNNNNSATLTISVSNNHSSKTTTMTATTTTITRNFKNLQDDQIAILNKIKSLRQDIIRDRNLFLKGEEQKKKEEQKRQQEQIKQEQIEKDLRKKIIEKQLEDLLSTPSTPKKVTSVVAASSSYILPKPLQLQLPPTESNNNNNNNNNNQTANSIQKEKKGG